MKEILIVGGGIAGTCLARALVDGGLEPARLRVLDAGCPRRGSAAPATMLHAFPGRSLAVRGFQQAAFVESFALMRRWQERYGGAWWREGAMARPFTEDEQGQRLRTSWERWHGEYPAPLRSEVLSPREARARFEGLVVDDDVVVYEPAAGVLIPEWLRVMSEALRADGVTLEQGTWRRGQAPEGTTVVLAMGTGLIPCFPGLDLRRKAGEVLVLDPGGRELPVFINGAGHLLQRPDGLWGLGSTYFPEEEWDARDDAAATEELLRGVDQLFPAVRDARVLTLWRGERCLFGSDHRPLLGPVPGAAAHYVFGALGSKGLLWGPALARLLAAHLLDEAPIPGGLSTARVKAHRWGH